MRLSPSRASLEACGQLRGTVVSSFATLRGITGVYLSSWDGLATLTCCVNVLASNNLVHLFTVARVRYAVLSAALGIQLLMYSIIQETYMHEAVLLLQAI